VHTRVNMVITPEQARYHVTEDRQAALEGLVEMTGLRAQGTFTRSRVVDGPLIPWESALIPDNLRTVVQYCIDRGAYRPFSGKTVGHFAVKIRDGEYATSIRKSDFNVDLREKGMVRVVTEGNHNVIAFGERPSVGGQSQRIIFKSHPEMDCIVHFHCPMLPDSKVRVRPQYAFECGSHECGQNTSDGLDEVAPGVKAVMLDQHGPNIVFSKDVDPAVVIDLIEANFDLTKTTRGYKEDAWDHAGFGAA
jgi:hypothetical protein